MRHKNLTLIGTSHVAIESIKEVENTILKLKPSIIALELDERRFRSLIAKKRRLRLREIKTLGIKGFLINVIGAWIEKKIGESVGVSPGSEMKKAIYLAKKNNINIALIDQDIKITMRKLAKRITFKEKMRFLIDLVKGIVLRRPDIKFDLRKVPDKKIIEEVIKRTKKRYPSFYKTIVVERNLIMARNLKQLTTKYPKDKIFAIVGAGHEEELINLVKAYKEAR